MFGCPDEELAPLEPCTVSGVVKDVIRKVIEQNGPLPKDKIIEKVLKERYVKENTILVNLQNPKFFKKDKEGRYYLA